MYAYYGLSVIPSLRDKLWWKKYITMFQLVSEKGFSIKSV
jgi:elongation of very long chain fatty acids protein 2/elongation of very long chain fatty acids protein 5